MINLKTKKEYNGRNIVTLSMIKNARGYNSSEWVTFLQARELGYKVRKGEKGVPILAVCENKTDDGKTKKGVRGYYVFNVEQLDKI